MKYNSYKHYLQLSGAEDTPDTYAAYRVAAEETNRQECMKASGETDWPAVNVALVSNMAKTPYQWTTRFCFPVPAEM